MSEGYSIAYGLEVSAGRLILARAVYRGAPLAPLVVALDSEEARRALASVSVEILNGTAALAVCAPAAHTVIRRLRAPFASAKKAAKVWASLMDMELPFPVEGAICCYGVPQIDNGGTGTLAAAIRKSDLSAFAETCRAAGYDPTHCDAEALALWDQQGVEVPPVRAEVPRAIVWLGPDHVTLVRGRGLVFMAAHVLRASPLTVGSGDRQAFETLWTARMRQILAAHLAETGATELDLWWAGPAAEDETLVTRLRKLLPADLSIRHETHRQSASFSARALARRAAAAVGVNFKIGEFAHPALLQKQEKNLKRAYLSVVAAALLVLALNLGDTLWRQHRANVVQRQLTTAAQFLVGYRVQRGTEILESERALARRDEETQPFRNALEVEGNEGRLARALDEAGAVGLEIARLALTSLALSIEGSAPSIQAIEGYAEQLRNQGWIIQSESPGRTPEGRQQFILKGTASHEG
jgi:hypothetical protein